MIEETLKVPIIIDMHCHPALKPYGRSIRRGRKNSKRTWRRNSIWHYDPPSRKDIKRQNLGLTRFSQSNFTALQKGKVRIVSACLSPIEVKLMQTKTGKDGFFVDRVANFITGIGKERVNEIQSFESYFKDLEHEYGFYKDMDGKEVTIDKKKYRYLLTKSFKDIEHNLNNENILLVFFSIEGSHVFDCGLDKPACKEKVLSNIDKLKKWDHRPLFISIAHHFYNELCGHAESIPSPLDLLIDQTEGMDSGFTPLGYDVLNELLDDTCGKRIYIDVKHMNPESRKEYYDYLDVHDENKSIPIIVSHGGVNGMKSFKNKNETIKGSQKKFRQSEINIFDHEIIKIQESSGFLGIQIDERCMASIQVIKKSKIDDLRTTQVMSCKQLEESAKMVWYQIQHVAEILDKKGKPAWNTATIGSDFDGIVDPPNGIWTAEEFKILRDHLITHAYIYLKNRKNKWKYRPNGIIKPSKIVDKFLYDNARKFLKRFYK